MLELRAGVSTRWSRTVDKGATRLSLLPTCEQASVQVWAGWLGLVRAKGGELIRGALRTRSYLRPRPKQLLHPVPCLFTTHVPLCRLGFSLRPAKTLGPLIFFIGKVNSVVLGMHSNRVQLLTQVCRSKFVAC